MSSCLYNITLIEKPAILQSLYITVAPYILIQFFTTTLFHSLSISSLSCVSFLHVSIKLLSYSPFTSSSCRLSYSVSQSNFQSSRYFYPFSIFLLPWSVFSWYVLSPSSLPLYQFCNKNILIFWPLPILFLQSTRPISLHLFDPLSKSIILTFVSTIFSVFAFYYILLISSHFLPLPSLCYSIFLIFSLCVLLSLLWPLVLCKSFSVFCCSSTICHSTHSLYVTVTLSLYLPLLLYNLFVAPMLFSCANSFLLSSFCVTLSRSLSLSLSFYYSQFR